ncbi:AraC family transcriptional regulator [Scatolibacter rhodanostii]|uniref:AraC family transcriptional regulator n=1 Tax=Scatolibacter rhodanostii TaxID=2014781 RepID=UPI000C078089|nr:AraC family transcriptional regulator [Scatolibacter rhodanostii]
MLPFYEHPIHSDFSAQGLSLSFPPHLHNAVECIRCVSGEIKIRIDNQNYTLTQGEIAFIFPNRIHSYFSDQSADNAYEFFVSSIKSNSPLYGIIHDKMPLNPILTPATMQADIPHQFHEVVMLLSQQPVDRLLTESLIQLIIARFLNELALVSIESKINEDLIGKAITYISRNFKTNITLESTAKYLGISKYYLSHMLKASLDMGICSYINNMRIDYAKNLLLTADLSISDIALESGYENMRTFNRCFKNVTGFSPSQFIKINTDLA